MNTGVTNAGAKIASSTELGGLYGVLESAEQVAGLIGPLLAGGLASFSANRSNSTNGGAEEGAAASPSWFYSMIVVTSCYSLAFVAILVYYRQAIVNVKTKQGTD